MSEYSLQISESHVSLPTALVDLLTLNLSISPDVARNSPTLQNEDLFKQLFHHDHLTNIRVQLEFNIPPKRNNYNNILSNPPVKTSSSTPKPKKKKSKAKNTSAGASNVQAQSNSNNNITGVNVPSVPNRSLDSSNVLTQSSSTEKGETQKTSSNTKTNTRGETIPTVPSAFSQSSSTRNLDSTTNSNVNTQSFTAEKKVENQINLQKTSPNTRINNNRESGSFPIVPSAPSSKISLFNKENKSTTIVPQSSTNVNSSTSRESKILQSADQVTTIESNTSVSSRTSVRDRVRQVNELSSIKNTGVSNSKPLSKQTTLVNESRGICLICFEPIESQLQLKNCKCSFCKKCQKELFESISFTSENDLNCSTCKQPYTYKDISAHISEANCSRFSKLKSQNAQPTEFDIECPSCSKTVDSRTADANNRLQCIYCGNVMCVKHKSPWHFNQKCDELDYAMELDSSNRASIAFIESTYTLCSKCNARIEKTSGCDHMVCKCGHEFCYLCGADYYTILRYSNDYHAPNCRYHSSNL